MQYFKIVFPDSNAYQILSRLGRVGKLHFVDKNPDHLALHKPFSNLLRKCNELEEMLQDAVKIMRRFDIKIKREPNLDMFFSIQDEAMREKKLSMEHYLNDLETVITGRVGKIKQMTANYDEIREKIVSFTEELDLFKVIKEIIPDNFT